MKRMIIFIMLSLVLFSVIFVGGCTPTTPKTSESGTSSAPEQGNSVPSGEGNSGLPVPPPLPE
ncbi:TPA: hypothetical protein HA249_05955 [Candidatus Woesearchaeota archaeon]|nr:hypothetical protein [Candidatus Woesearchaeota archaeon]